MLRRFWLVARREEGSIARNQESKNSVTHRDWKTDLLILGLPANGLAAVWPAVGEFPFVEPEGVQAWQEPLEEWLADIGRSVFRMCSFRTPASGSKSRRPIRKSGCVRPTCRPRESAGSAFCGELDELAWYPTTLWGGPVGTTWDGLVDVTPWEIRLRSWLRRRRERRRRQAGAR